MPQNGFVVTRAGRASAAGASTACWSVTGDFGLGDAFTFTASAPDGVRVQLDGVRKIDLSQSTGATARSTNVNLTVPKGRHTFRVDHVNWTGAARRVHLHPRGPGPRSTRRIPSPPPA